MVYLSEIVIFNNFLPVKSGDLERFFLAKLMFSQRAPGHLQMKVTRPSLTRRRVDAQGTMAFGHCYSGGEQYLVVGGAQGLGATRCARCTHR